MPFPGAPPPRLSSARMVRISWPLAILLVAVIVVLARQPRLIGWTLLAFVVWFTLEWLRARRRR